MATLFEIRGDTAANWTAVNPVLFARQEAVETDTHRRKIGDGVTAWNALPYVTALPADVVDAQAYAIQRANHTGTQPATTLTGLDAAVAGAVTPGGSATAAAIAADPALRAAYVPTPTGGTDGQALVKSGSAVTWGAAGLTATQIAADPTVKSTFAPMGGPLTRLRAVALGDSTVAGNLRDSFTTTVNTSTAWSFPHAIIGEEQAGMLSWFTWACLLSGGRLLNMHNGGVASDTSTGCLARFDTSVTAYKPDVMLASFGVHNDFSTGASTATTKANVVAMIRKARQAGIMPILVTVYPENNATWAPMCRAHNAWLKNLAAGRDPNYPDISGLLVVDTYSAVVDTASATGAWISGYTVDGTHAVEQAAVLAGQKVVNDLAGLLRGNTNGIGPFAAVDAVTGPTNLLTNPILLTDGNADGKADNWVCTGTGVTWSLVTDSAIIGKAQQMVVASGNVTFKQSVTVGTSINVGDKVKFAGMVKATVGGSLSWYVEMNYAGASQIVFPINQSTRDVGWTYFECEGIVPTGATNVTVTWGSTGTFSGTLLAAMPCLINVSTL